MTVWPSLSATGFGRFWGRLFAIEYGFRIFGVPLTVGRLTALASIPFMVALYFLMRLPRFPFILIGIKNPFCWHYRLTNRRIVMENPFGDEIKSAVAGSVRFHRDCDRAGPGVVQSGRPGVSPRRNGNVSHLGRAAAGDIPPDVPQGADVVRWRAESAGRRHGGLTFGRFSRRFAGRCCVGLEFFAVAERLAEGDAEFFLAALVDQRSRLDRNDLAFQRADFKRITRRQVKRFARRADINPRLQRIASADGARESGLLGVVKLRWRTRVATFAWRPRRSVNADQITIAEALLIFLQTGELQAFRITFWQFVRGDCAGQAECFDFERRLNLRGALRPSSIAGW